MTTVQLFHRIARRARPAKGPGGDFTALSLTEQTDLMEAANSAMQTVYGLLPTVYRELTEGFVLPAPVTISLAVTNNSNVVAATTFTDAQIGQSVAVDGDTNWNQILATDRLLNPYLGTTGIVSATVYGDACYSTRYPFDRIIGNPRFPNQGANLLFNPNLMQLNAGAPVWFYSQTIGMPMYWWTQMLGNSQGNEPLLVLRFSPAPDTTYTVDVRSSYWPKRLTLADYDDATIIPVPDQFLERSMIPIALRALMMTPIWDGKGDPNIIISAAESGETFLKMQPGQIAAPNNRIYTPVGY